jgi:hypothetical protein
MGAVLFFSGITVSEEKRTLHSELPYLSLRQNQLFKDGLIERPTIFTVSTTINDKYSSMVTQCHLKRDFLLLSKIMVKNFPIMKR